MTSLITSRLIAAGSDYVAKTDFRIRWRPNTVDPRYVPTPSTNDPVFEFTIVNDDIPEAPREYFEIDLSLSTANGRNGFFFPDAIGRVTILDDDIREFMTAKVLL